MGGTHTEELLVLSGNIGGQNPARRQCLLSMEMRVRAWVLRTCAIRCGCLEMLVIEHNVSVVNKDHVENNFLTKKLTQERLECPDIHKQYPC